MSSIASWLKVSPDKVYFCLLSSSDAKLNVNVLFLSRDPYSDDPYSEEDVPRRPPPRGDPYARDPYAAPPAARYPPPR